MDIRHADAAGVAGNLRVVPFHREGDRSIAQHAEVIAVVRVLPDVLAGENQIFSEGLLEAGVKFVAPARTQRSAGRTRSSRAADSSTGLAHPTLESTRFSLNGVSRIARRRGEEPCWSA